MRTDRGRPGFCAAGWRHDSLTHSISVIQVHAGVAVDGGFQVRAGLPAQAPS